MGEKLFDQLRTKEQLGYVASGSLETLYDVSGFRVTVESAFHAPAFVEERINAFLCGFPAQVRAMDDAEFVKTRRSLVDSVLTMDVSLSAEADRHWTHVTNQKYQFYRGQIIAGLIDGVSKREVVAWLEANLAPTAAAPATRRVTIHVHGKNHPLNGAARNASRNAMRPTPWTVLKKWGYHPAQGDPTNVPALEMPPEAMARLSNIDVAAARAKAAKAMAEASGAARGGDEAPRTMNQWAQRLADRRAACAVGCAVSETVAGGTVQDAAADAMILRRRQRGTIVRETRSSR